MTTSGLSSPGGGSGTITNSYGYDQAGEGATNEVASDGSSSYSRDPAGRITGVNSAAGGALGAASAALLRPG